MPLTLKEFGLILIIQAFETQKCFISNYYLWFHKSILICAFLSWQPYLRVHTPKPTQTHTDTHPQIPPTFTQPLSCLNGGKEGNGILGKEEA